MLTVDLRKGGTPDKDAGLGFRGFRAQGLQGLGFRLLFNLITKPGREPMMKHPTSYA